MSWRIAKSLEKLRMQLNALYPNRSKVSDGGIGNAEHASRESDHNPWVKDSKGQGVVTARDFTFDDNPADGIGIDGQSLVDCLVANRDPRIKYIIWNRRIISSKQSPWVWRKYTGKNAHKHHVHISVMPEEKLFDSEKAWNLDQLKPVSAELSSLEIKPASQPPDISGESGKDSIADNPVSEQNTAQINPPAPEQTTEQTNIDAPQGQTQITETKNQQDVNVTAEVAEPAPQGIGTKLKAGIGSLMGGTVIYTVAEKFGAMSFSMQAIILFAVVAVIALIGFCFWAWLDAWKQNQRVKLEVESKTAIDKKDLVWVKPE